MNSEYVEGIKIVLLLWIIGLLSQILRYMKMMWSKICEIHRVIEKK